MGLMKMFDPLLLLLLLLWGGVVGGVTCPPGWCPAALFPEALIKVSNQVIYIPNCKVISPACP